MSSSTTPICVVAGIGGGHGTGAASAREFSKAGYRVAMLSRTVESLNKLVAELSDAGGDVLAFPLTAYDYAGMHSAFAAIRAQWPGAPIRVAVYNAGEAVFKPFLQVTEADVKLVVDTNVHGAFAFSHEVILAFKDQELDDVGKRGTLIFTGATAGIRGNKLTSAFSAGKFAMRSLSQSLAKEFGPQNIHVATAIIDGNILTDRSRVHQNYEEYSKNEDVRLNPESIAKSYIYLANQDRSAWTWELDLRPAHESW